MQFPCSLSISDYAKPSRLVNNLRPLWSSANFDNSRVGLANVHLFKLHITKPASSITTVCDHILSRCAFDRAYAIGLDKRCKVCNFSSSRERKMGILLSCVMQPNGPYHEIECFYMWPYGPPHLKGFNRGRRLLHCRTKMAVLSPFIPIKFPKEQFLCC